LGIYEERHAFDTKGAVRFLASVSNRSCSAATEAF
jgi:hypothetical protein